MRPDRSIIHLNVADFAVAVERVVDTSLQKKPVIVAPLQAARAAVYDMSEEAYKDGVRKGMLLRQASRLCRTARVLVPRPELYRRAMQAFVAEAREYTPVVEHGVEDGHLFLDLTGTHRLFGAAPDVGWRLRKQVHEKLRIEPIWSLAANKLVSKVASRLVKPVGEYIVAPGEEEVFLSPLPLALLPGIGLDERRLLLEFNIRKVGQLASLRRTQLYDVFGHRGGRLYEISHGIDNDLVMSQVNRTPKICNEHIFADDTGDYRELEAVVSSLAVQAGMALRAARMAGRRVALCLHYTDGSRTIRQASTRQGRSDDFSLRRLALLALKRAMIRRVRVRSCQLICDRLSRQSPQLPLFSEPDRVAARHEKLGTALDAIRNRYGRAAVRFGSQATLH